MNNLQTLQSLIDRLREEGNQPAVLALHKEDVDEWSYAQLAEYVRRLANGLHEAGVGPADTVVLLANNRPEWIATCLAVIAAGAVVTPVDVQFGDETLQHVLRDCAARYIFTTSDQVERFAHIKLEGEVECILFDADTDDARSWQRWLSDTEADRPRAAPDDTVTLFYTSGTTGPPKGVPLSHANLTFQIETVIAADIVTENERILLPLPLHHVYPFVMGMLAPLAIGLPLILPHALTGPQIVRALREGQATMIIGVPRLYDALFSGIQEQVAAGGRLAAAIFNAVYGVSRFLRRRLGLRAGKLLLRPLHQQFGPQLRVLASGGSAIDPELAWKLESLGWQVGTGYGLTETAPLLALNPPGAARIGAAGKPIDNVTIHIDPAARADEQEAAEEPSTHGATAAQPEGEILARGPNVFAGYRNLPDKTAEVFTADGWFRTGDLGYCDADGYLYVTGRVSTQIVTASGENIQPQAVEEAYEAHPVIREIGVLQKDDQLVAAIVPELREIDKREGEIGPAIRTAVEEQGQKLASYQRIADYAVTREALPRTRLGKIRRHLLPEHYARARQAAGWDEADIGPISLEEMAAADRELLRDPAARQVWDWLANRYSDRHLTPDTSPQLDLDIGSLEWVDLTLQIRQRSGVELDEDAIGRVESVRDLLHEVADASASRADARSMLEEPERMLDDRQKRWLEPLDPVRATLARGMYALDRLLIRSLLGLNVAGLEHLPEEGPYILTPNHISYLDAPTIAAALDHGRLRQIYWAGAADVVFDNPLLRLIGRLAQVVPVTRRQQAVMSSLAYAAAVLQRDKILVWFPEGYISRTGELQPFKTGIGMLLEHFHVPVVPVRLEGTNAVLPPDTRVPRRLWHAVSVRFGAPLSVDILEEEGEGDHPQERITQALHDRMAQLG